MAKRKIKKKTGPTPDVLKIEGDPGQAFDRLWKTAPLIKPKPSKKKHRRP